MSDVDAALEDVGRAFILKSAGVSTETAVETTVGQKASPEASDEGAKKGGDWPHHEPGHAGEAGEIYVGDNELLREFVAEFGLTWENLPDERRERINDLVGRLLVVQRENQETGQKTMSYDTDELTDKIVQRMRIFNDKNRRDDLGRSKGRAGTPPNDPTVDDHGNPTYSPHVSEREKREALDDLLEDVEGDYPDADHGVGQKTDSDGEDSGVDAADLETQIQEIADSEVW